MMRIYAGMLTAFLLSTVSLAVYAGEYDFKPGLWETTSKMKVTGVPKQMAAMMATAPMTEQHCMTEKELFMNTDDGCKYDKKRVSSKKLKVTMACNTPNGIDKGRGEVNFNGKKVTGWFEMNSRGPSGPMKMKNTFTARYLGACK